MNCSTGFSLRPSWLLKAFCCTFLLIPFHLAAQVGVRNLFSLDGSQAWRSSHPEQSLKLLWQPELDYTIGSFDRARFSSSLSSQSYLTGLEDKPELDTKLYRAWGKVDFSAISLCLGLQRINFGTADLIRPQQWFDRLSPLDKSEETEGVVAALGSIALGSTGKMMLWAIRSEDECRGNEFIPSLPDMVEPGARLELPAGPVFTGLSYHYRKAGTSSFPETEEHRLGFDLRWDGLFGAWLESSGSYFSSEDEVPYPSLQTAFSLGADYTVGLGNGLYLRQETGFMHVSGEDFAALHTETLNTALLISYPMSLLDNVQALGVYDWSSRLVTTTLQISRIYDYWSFFLSASQVFERATHPELRLRIALNI